MNTKRLLHMDSDIPSIYFPIGDLKSGGSCEFASKKCKELCPSGMKVNCHEKYAFKFFKDNSTNKIYFKLLEDFNALAGVIYNAKMIQWFTWGDCPSSMTDKVAKVINKIFKYQIPQYGFTRNKNLWEIVPSNRILNIGLTIESLKEAKKVSVKSKKMVSCPDFEHGYARMIFNGKIVSECNGWWCKTELETRNSDCSTCLSHGEGCYFT